MDRGLARLLEIDVTIAVLLAIVILSGFPIIDPDFFWHLKTGEMILAEGRLLASDQFSHSVYGTSITVTGWLFDVILATFWDLGGKTAVRALVAGMTVLLWLVCYATARRFIARKEGAAILALSTIALMTVTIAPRPNLFSHLGVALTLYLLLRFRASTSLKHLAWIVPLFAVWPNFHYGFAMGIVLVVLHITAALLDRLLPLGEQHPRDPILSAGALLVLLAAVLAVGLNPYGYEVYHELTTMTLRASESQVAEWRSPDFRSAYGRLLLVSIIAFVLLKTLAPRAVSWTAVAIPTAMLALALTSQRHLPFWAIAFCAYAADTISKLPPMTSQGFLARFVRLRPGSIDLNPRISRTINLLIVVTMVVVAPIGGTYIQRRFEVIGETLLPEKAVSFLLDHSVSGRLFNLYGSGGYIIWRANPQLPVFIDGRYAPYPKAVIDDYMRIANAAPDALDLLGKYKVDIVLYVTGSGLSTLLTRYPGYRLVYSDEDFSVFVADDSRYSTLKSVRLHSSPRVGNERPPKTLVPSSGRMDGSDGS